MTTHTAELREAIARIINPYAWEAAPHGHFIAQSVSLATADAILALLPTQGTEYRRAIEDAARVSEEELENRRAEQKRDFFDNFLRGQINTALRLADAIRALIDPPVNNR